MCSPTTCSACGRPSYRGCGNHVEQVLGHVAVADRCQCRTSARASAGAGTGTGRRFPFGRRR